MAGGWVFVYSAAAADRCRVSNLVPMCYHIALVCTRLAQHAAPTCLDSCSFATNVARRCRCPSLTAHNLLLRRAVVLLCSPAPLTCAAPLALRFFHRPGLDRATIRPGFRRHSPFQKTTYRPPHGQCPCRVVVSPSRQRLFPMPADKRFSLRYVILRRYLFRSERYSPSQSATRPSDCSCAPRLPSARASPSTSLPTHPAPLVPAMR